MESQEITVENATTFLEKTYAIVNDSSNDDIISWNENGTAFVVWHPEFFERDILPKAFKHANFSSFIRQLNNYDFHKINSRRYEFALRGFRRGRPDLLPTNKRPKSKVNQRRLQMHSNGTSNEAVLPQPIEFGPGEGEITRYNPNAAAINYQGQGFNDEEAASSSNGNGGENGSMFQATAAGRRTSGEEMQQRELRRDVEQLKKDRLLLLKEVMRLRDQQVRSQQQVTELSDRVRQQEAIQQNIVALLHQYNIGTHDRHGGSQGEHMGAFMGEQEVGGRAASHNSKRNRLQIENRGAAGGEAAHVPPQPPASNVYNGNFDDRHGKEDLNWAIDRYTGGSNNDAQLCQRNQHSSQHSPESRLLGGAEQHNSQSRIRELQGEGEGEEARGQQGDLDEAQNQRLALPWEPQSSMDILSNDEIDQLFFSIDNETQSSPLSLPPISSPELDSRDDDNANSSQ